MGRTAKAACLPDCGRTLLRDYDIRPVVVHPTKRADFSGHGYRAAHFENAFARFLPHEPNIRNTQERAREDVDVRMFGCLPRDAPHREGGLLAGLRTYLPLSRTTLTQQFFGSAPQTSATLPCNCRRRPRSCYRENPKRHLK